jgi:general secretion pathway protein G
MAADVMNVPEPRPPPLPEPEDGLDEFDVHDERDYPRAPPSATKIVLWIVLGVVGAIVVFGLLIPILGPKIFHAVHDGHTGAARAEMGVLGCAVDIYRMNHKRLPESLQDLLATDAENPYPILDGDRIPLDPWGNEYEYKVLDPKTYEIQCWGEDGQPDTEDDLYFPERDEYE